MKKLSSLLVYVGLGFAGYILYKKWKERKSCPISNENGTVHILPYPYSPIDSV